MLIEEFCAECRRSVRLAPMSAFVLCAVLLSSSLLLSAH